MKKTIQQNDIDFTIEFVSNILKNDVLGLLSARSQQISELAQQKESINLNELSALFNQQLSVASLIKGCICLIKQLSKNNEEEDLELNLDKELESAVIALNNELEINSIKMNLLCNFSDDEVFVKGDELLFSTIVFNLFYLAYGSFSQNKVEFSCSFESGFATISMKYTGQRNKIIEDHSSEKFDFIQNSQNSHITNSYLILKTLEKFGVGLISYSGESNFNIINFTLHQKAKVLPKSKIFESNDFLSKRRNWSDKTVLIVDDIEVNFFFIDTILSETGIKTIYAENGQIAVDLCKENNNIDVVLMDIKMPVLDGLEATLQIKSFKPELPIVILTAYSFNEEKQKSINSKCNDFLTKPLKSENVIDVLSKYISPS